MKRATIFLFVFVLATFSMKAQTFASLNEVKFENEESYGEYIDQVFDCCYYLLQTPFNKKDADRQLASDFIGRWLEGTPLLSFKLNENIKVITEEREDLLAMYKTCFAKELLENEESASDTKTIENGAVNALVDYCANSGNKVKMTKEMKKLQELKSSGEIASIAEYVSSLK